MSVHEPQASVIVTLDGVCTCEQVCTYSGNQPRILRCDICDSVRGTRWDYYLGQGTEACSGSQPPAGAAAAAAAAGEGTAARGSDSHQERSAAAVARDSPSARDSRGGKGSGAAARGQRSILGFFSEADRRDAAAAAAAVSAGERRWNPGEGRERGTEGQREPQGSKEHCSAQRQGGKMVFCGSEQRGVERIAKSEGGECREAVGSSVGWEQSGDGRWICSACSASVAEEGRAEHEDYHLALLLQQAESGDTYDSACPSIEHPLQLNNPMCCASQLTYGRASCVVPGGELRQISHTGGGGGKQQCHEKLIATRSQPRIKKRKSEHAGNSRGRSQALMSFMKRAHVNQKQ